MNNRKTLIIALCSVALLALVVAFVVMPKDTDPITTAFRTMHTQIHNGDTVDDVERALSTKLVPTEPPPAQMVDWFGDRKQGYRNTDGVFQVKVLDREFYFQFRDGRLINHSNDMWAGDPNEVVISGLAN